MLRALPAVRIRFMSQESNPQSTSSPEPNAKQLPLAGLRVVEFSHMVMGPTCGLVLADLGAEVIKVEPVDGDRTRHLLGAGAGFFPLFNRNKKSVALNLRHPRGVEAALRLAATADVVVQNFKPGSLAKLGLDYTTLAKTNSGLVYVNLTGFLPGPYAHRSALDEVVQMMGGLAYMTGRSGDPLRAGASVNDIMGGMFGAIGAMAALMQRNQTGRGQEVDSALFENNIFLVAQHMMQFSVTGQAAAPMPERIHSWGVYDIFTAADGGQIFLAAVSDPQWERLCAVFGFDDLAEDAGLTSNNDRVRARDTLIPQLRQRFGRLTVSELADRFEAEALPYARIEKPEDLLHDPHLEASGGLASMVLPDGERAGEQALTALLPLRMAGERLGVRSDPPRFATDTTRVLKAVGYSDQEIAAMVGAGAVCAAQ